jgi:hypothetical protein
MTTLAQLTSNQAQKEVLINENFKDVAPAGLFSNKALSTTGLNFYYYGGKFVDKDGTINTIADNYILMTVSATNYVEYNIHTNAVVSNTTGFTDYNIPIATIACDSTKITSYTDARIIPLLEKGSNNKRLNKIIEYTSAITTNSTINQAHSTTDIKFNIVATLKCLTAEHGWSGGDEIDFIQVDSGSAIMPKSTFLNSTNYGMVVGSTLKIAHKTSFTMQTITPANWNIVLRLVPIY